MGKPPEEFGRAMSPALEEVRSVLTRARTALRRLGTDPQWTVVPRKPVYSETEFTVQEWTDRRGEIQSLKNRKFLGYNEAETVPHPGAAEMIHGLKECVRLLEEFERTGKTKYRG